MLHVETGLIQLYIVRLISKLALGNKATDRSLGMAYLNPTVAELLNSYDPKKDGANEFCFEFTPVEEVTNAIVERFRDKIMSISMRQAKDFPKIYAFANHSTGIKLAELLREDDYPGMIYSGELGSQPSLLVYHIYLDEEAIPRAELLDIPTN